MLYSSACNKFSLIFLKSCECAYIIYYRKDVFYFNSFTPLKMSFPLVLSEVKCPQGSPAYTDFKWILSLIFMLNIAFFYGIRYMNACSSFLDT